MKACPGLRSGIDSRHSSRHWYEKALKRLSSAPANPFIRHSREGGNPRTNIPRKKANRDTTTCVQTATPLGLSGKNRPEPRYGPGIQVRWRSGKNDTQTLPGDGHPFSYLGVPVATGMSDWYENDVTRFRKCFGVPEILGIVIPAKAGIQKGMGGDFARRGACPPLGSEPGAWQKIRRVPWCARAA